MKKPATKGNSALSQSSQPFFNKKGEGSLISSTNEQEQPFFSPNPVSQKKPTNSSFSVGKNVADTPFPRPNAFIQPKLTHVVQQQKEVSDILQRDDNTAVDPIIAAGDLADNVERKYVLGKWESQKMKLGKYADGKFSLKLSMIRGKSPGTKGKQDINVPGTDIVAPVTGSAKIGKFETDTLFEKYALKIGSFAGEGNIDLGCKLKLKLGVDLVKIEGSGAVKFGLPSPSASVRLEKSDFDNPSDCLITEMLSHGGSNVPELVQQGWRVDVELKFDISLDPQEIAKAIAIKKAEEELKDLGKKATDLDAKTSKAKKDWESRGSKRQRAKRKGKWHTSKKAKKLKKEAEAIAKKIAGKTDDIAKIGKGMKSPWGRKFAEKSLGWAKSFGLKALGKVLVVLAILDTVVSIAKIIKYWDKIEFKFPWDSSGMSLDDAPLFGDVPQGGTAEGKSATGVAGDNEGSLADGGSRDASAKEGDNVASGEQGNAKEPAENTGKDGDSPGIIDETEAKTSDKTEDVLSRESIEKIQNLAEPVQELVMEMILGKNGPKVTDDVLNEILKRIPPTLTQEQSEQLQDAIASADGRTLDEVLQDLEKAVASVINPSASQTNPVSADQTQPDQKQQEPIKPNPAEVSHDDNPAKVPSKAPVPDPEQAPQVSGPSKIGLHNYIIAQVFIKGTDNKYEVKPGAIEQLKKEGIYWESPEGYIDFSVEITANISELKDSADIKSMLQKLEVKTVLTVLSTTLPGNTKFKQGEVLTTFTADSWNPATGDAVPISSFPIAEQLMELTESSSGKLTLKSSARDVAHNFGSFWAKVEIQSAGEQLTQITFTPTKLNDPSANLILKGVINRLKVGVPLVIDF